MCARIINPYDLDDDDDAIFSGAMASGLIWIEDDDEIEDDDGIEQNINYIYSWYKEVRKLKIHSNPMNNITISNDFAISASPDQKLCVWNWKTGKLLHKIAHKNAIVNIVIESEYVIASTLEEISVWNWKTGKLLHTFSEQSHSGAIIASDGDILAIASKYDVQIWNWKTRELIREFTGIHQDIITTVAISDNLILSYSIGKLLVRDWKSNKIVHNIDSSPITYNDVVNGDIIILVDEEDVIDVWNWKLGKALLPNSKDMKHIHKRVFAHPLGIYIYDMERKWSFYTWHHEHERIFTLTEDFKHMILSNFDGIINVYKISLPIINNQSEKISLPDITNEDVIVDENYTIEDIIKVAIEFIRKRNGQWVNFSRLSHHLHEMFTDLNPKNLGKPNKNYKSLLKLIADYPNHFEIRQDTAKQGLFWIRLK